MSAFMLLDLCCSTSKRAPDGRMALSQSGARREDRLGQEVSDSDSVRLRQARESAGTMLSERVLKPYARNHTLFSSSIFRAFTALQIASILYLRRRRSWHLLECNLEIVVLKLGIS